MLGGSAEKLLEAGDTNPTWILNVFGLAVNHCSQSKDYLLMLLCTRFLLLIALRGKNQPTGVALVPKKNLLIHHLSASLFGFL